MNIFDAPLRMYSFMDSQYYENIDLYEPKDEYIKVAKNALPDGWNIKIRGFWVMCLPSGWESIPHGWKIHVSSVSKNAIEVINIVASLLANLNVAFKFCSDSRMLRLSLSKTWSRFQAGKFIAIYPQNEEIFKIILEELYKKTSHLNGPHILTDRPYKDSSAVYYRYGAHSGKNRIDVYGNKHPGFELEDGTWYEDIRGPSFRLPPGRVDLFAGDIVNEVPKAILLNERYRVLGVIKYSAMGGIYYGVDTKSNREIVIREVRGTLGHLESDDESDQALVLKREAKILKKLSSTKLVPEFVDLFKEWKNWFLVEEKLSAATSLWGKSMEFYFFEEESNVSFGLNKMLETIETIIIGLKAIHSHGVVLRDLTKTNLMFMDDGSVKFIDLEFAYEVKDTAPWVNGWTPGYGSKEQVELQRPVFEDDYYALGVLILDMLTFCASGIETSRNAIIDRKLPQVLADLNLPSQLYDLVCGLTEIDKNLRWNLEMAHEFVLGLKTFKVPSGILMFPSREDLLNVDPPAQSLIEKLSHTQMGLINYLQGSCALQRDDRLWPASPPVFFNNPVSLQYGAVGPAWLLLRSLGHLSSDIVEWIDKRSQRETCPPGLYSGVCGAALLFLYGGYHDVAAEKMLQVEKSTIVFDSPSLYFGCAGWGLTNLHFWHVTRQSKYLDTAKRIGRWLVERAKSSEFGVYWPDGNITYLGLGDGQSGIALFLTYLGAACGTGDFISTAAKALDFDIAHAIKIYGRMIWRFHTKSHENEPNLPHTRFGSAGVGSACIRYYAMTGLEKYKDIALECSYAVRSRVTNKIWQDSGNAGFGEYLLDMSHILKDDRYKNLAFYQAEAILPHALTHSGGVAFAGPDHIKICNEYGMGGAGIGMFFDRLLGDKQRLLMLDDLLV